MTLADLLRALDEWSGGRPVRAAAPATASALARTVTGVSYDSRRTSPGDMFVALRGLRADGATFTAQAVLRGALVVIAETDPPAGSTAPWYVVENARAVLAALATILAGHPSRDLSVVGVTGTNGKTTTAYLLHAMFEAAGIRCGLMGTVSYRIGDEEREADRTTPEAPDVQRMLREMVDRGCGACAMEVSSHALSLDRVSGMRFAAGVFTNLTRDHLDYHRDMESYFLAKRRLFELLPPDAAAVINLDDPRGAALVGVGGRAMTYALDRPADVSATGPLTFTLDGLSFEARTPAGVLRVRSRLVGRPNVYNILAAVATGVALGLPNALIEQGIASLEGVPGRFQVVSGVDDDVTAVVDYAHTDDALKNLLETARPMASRRLITVFGCGGERDRTKRPLMGAVAARMSDVIVITSDNPRSEDPEQIIEEVKLGVPGGADRGPGRASAVTDRPPSCLAIVDRRKAIERAVQLAERNDVILIAGKGHEKTQVIGDRALPHDDVAVAREALADRRERFHAST